MQLTPSTVYRGHFLFDPDDPIYRDHFPGYAVVPGSLIIHAFMQAAKAITGKEHLRCASNFRFKRFITPGRYAYSIEPAQDGRLACSLFSQHQAVVTGTL